MDSLIALRDAAAAASLSASRLAERSGLSRASTYRILDGSVDPRLSDLRELFLAAGLSIEVSVSPLHDLAAAAAARVLLSGSFESQSPDVAGWITRLRRLGRGEPVATVRESGSATSVLHDSDAVALRYVRRPEIDRLVSAGRASEGRWALSGGASLDALGHDTSAPSLFWVDDVRRVTHLLADTLSRTSPERAEVFLTRGDDEVFAHTVEVEGVILVDRLRALIDCAGLGGEAAVLALELAGGTR